MAFKSDKQRKAFFAGRGNPRSSVTPEFFIASGKVKGKQLKVIVESTASRKTLKRTAGVPTNLKRISKSRAKQLIRLGRSRGFKATSVKRLGKGRIKTIGLKVN